MNVKYFSVFLTIVAVVKANKFVDELLSASEHETTLNEDLARLLEVDFERQGSCGTEVNEQCCTACGYDGSCYNGGFCCESSKVRTRMLKSGEIECPSSWTSECKMTKLVPIESCNLGRKSWKGSDSDSGSGSDEDRQLDRAGVRLMCLCLSTRRCCSGLAQTTTATSYYDPYTSKPWYYGSTYPYWVK